ncbi:FUSC family protein [Pseudoflavonifractor phocaeensis]|uniref:FUSC family protein n=1 Tax=Pseudoflavonifractor phocaeensis TaxID=1870988 RepID=UPI00313EA959
MYNLIQIAAERVRGTFARATLNFIFIILFVNVFQAIFGPENSIVGVIFTIMMSASMVRDMTATPWKHLLIQAAVLVWMGVSACLVVTLPPLAALPINFATIFGILYAFTYEYATHMYFPYILSYLFLVFISPVGLGQLPKRLIGLLAGAVCVILYQLFMGRNRVAETAQGVLTAMVDQARASVRFARSGEGAPASPEEVRGTLCRLSRTVYERRRRVLQVSDASFSMIDAGRGLENLVLLLAEHTLSPALLQAVDGQLCQIRAFLQREADALPAPDPAWFLPEGRAEKELYDTLEYTCGHLRHMTDPDTRRHYRPTALSFSVRLKAALDVSPVRVLYALRVSLLLAAFTLLVQALALPHGKWLLFTLASLSLPYADDVGTKTRKRVAATILGGLVSVAAYALIPSMAGRTAVMMLSGYLTFYFSDYTGTYACSTIGALGGAVVTGAFGWGPVGQMFAIRLGYICVGALIALAANCLFFPYKRDTATRQLLKKYAATTDLLTRVSQEDSPDPQLYYDLVIQAHLQEEKLAQNAAQGCWPEIGAILAQGRERVRRAHRHWAPLAT